MDLKKIKEKKEIELLLVVVAIIQILLLINLTSANSYTISNFNLNENSNIIINHNNFNNLITSGLNLLIGFLSIKQIGSVSAQGDWWCCVDGTPSCQDVEVGDTNSCSNPVQSSCEDTSECTLGTCIDENEGTCSASTEIECTQGGNWEEDLIEDVPECRLGCCIYGNNIAFTTEDNCGYIAGNDWNFISETETECIDRVESFFDGACVFGDGSCEITSDGDCDDKGGDFNEGSLCTDQSLGTNCEPSTDTICINDHVYFLDDCKNPANIYDANKINTQSYWDEIIDVEDTECIDSNVKKCGLCEPPKVSKCVEYNSDIDSDSPDYGTNICRDITCEDQYFKDNIAGGVRDPNNGESWCVYESFVGKSKDVVGSDSWRKYCEDGEVILDPNPSTARGLICAQEKIVDSEGEFFSRAEYRFNQWPSCVNILLEDQEDRDECTNLPDCEILTVDVTDGEFHLLSDDDTFKFEVCAPKYPKGFNLDRLNTEEQEENEKFCGFASQTCTIIEDKDPLDPTGSWECVTNCECKKTIFLEQMNDFCVSLGDCGGYINIEGEYTKNYEVDSNAGNVENKLNAVDLKERYEGLEDISSNDEKPEYIPNAPSVTDHINLIVQFKDPDTESYDWEDSLGRLFGKDSRKRTITFNCEPWQAPSGGNDCGKCNNNPLGIPCTEYKCNSLGTACKIEKDVEGVKLICFEEDATDRTPPVIKNLKVEANGVEIHTEESPGISIDASGNCFEDNSLVNVKLKTENEIGEDDPAVCKYEFTTVVSDLIDIRNDYDKGDNSFFIEHNFEEYFSINDENLNLDLEKGITETTGIFSMHIRCQDLNGNPNIDEYVIDLCISDQDTTAPTITDFQPENNGFLKYGETNTSLIISLNEPALCKWDLAGSKDYESMDFDFDFCDFPNLIDISEDDYPLNGFCSTELTGLTQPENIVYIRCKDYNGNARQTDREYILYSTQNLLEINSIFITSHNNIQGDVFHALDLSGISTEIRGGGFSFKIDLEAITTGGAKNGEASCNFEYSSNHPQFNGGLMGGISTTHHKQPNLNLPNGDYNILITCDDLAGNEATENAMFSLAVDQSAPVVVRVFKDKDSGRLKLTTNEAAKCSYKFDSTNNCNFNVEDGMQMTTGFSTTHNTNWDPGEKYYVKCKDFWDNENARCARIITPDYKLE